ncbi:prolipoprotein diacylglyceryl transferase [Aquimixticola soesokkakensis]|nr:prolipoprotein diacylglyceryl transferase [Aquimixticola soesokkakensis]
MPAVLQFPDLSPEIFSITLGGFSFALRWYALAYIAGIVIAWKLCTAALARDRLWPSNRAPMAPQNFEDLLTWIILGVIVGGRLGYVLFYRPGYYLANPVEIPMVWTGGMSFHGGFLGVVIAALAYGLRHKIALLSLGDLMAMATPPGLMLGRIANFINDELWGRPSTLPWAVVFPSDPAQDCPGVIGPCARHPSQLYEAGMEGLILGSLLIVLAWRFGAFKRRGLILGLFLAGYGLSRFIVEFFRQADGQFITPDNPLGHVALGMSMGQLLSLPMLLLGLVLAARAWRAPRA